MKLPLAIIAGGGSLPLMLYNHCIAENRPCSVFGIKNAYHENLWENIPIISVPLGNIGELFDNLRARHITEITLVGDIKRPKFSSLSCDALGMKLIGRIVKQVFKGDNAILKTVISFIEEAGFKVVGVDQVMPSLIAPSGQWGVHGVNPSIKEDILYGMEIAHKIGQYDIGQSVVISGRRVIGIEAAEGTDALIARCGMYEQGNILIKAKKPNQEKNVDLPTIGLSTVENVIKHGFSGIAIEAGGSLVLDYTSMVKKANDAGIFIIGVAP